MSITETNSSIHYPVAELIRERKSVRAYQSRPVEQEKINSLFEAVRWAPSSSNEQPWFYIYATPDQPELYQKISGLLNEGNKIWAGQAPLLVISMARKYFKKNEKPNHHALYDLGGANSFLALQAVHMGLQVRQMAGYNKDLAVQLLNIPESFEPGVIIAIGYPGDPANLPPVLMERELKPRERIPQTGFVSTKEF
jgi:nitroreductase